MQVGPGVDAQGRPATVALETGAVVAPTSEENYLFALDAFAAPLRAHFASHPDGAFLWAWRMFGQHAHFLAGWRAAVQPRSQREVVEQLLAGGPLPPLSVSRRRGALTWGLPVPGDDAHLVGRGIGVCIDGGV